MTGRQLRTGQGEKLSQDMVTKPLPARQEDWGQPAFPVKESWISQSGPFDPFLIGLQEWESLPLALVVFGNWGWWILKLLRPVGVCRGSYPQLSTPSLPTGRWGLFSSTSANLSLYEKEHKRNPAGENEQEGVWGWESLVRTPWRWRSLLLLLKR